MVRPTTRVRESFLAGEWASCIEDGAPTDWLDPAFGDFETFVAERRDVQQRWDVPCSTFWYVSGETYIGTVIVRHRLTPELMEAGGHIGYHVVPEHRRQGHATRMLAAGLAECRRLGLDRALLTCAADNEPSHRVIRANGGVYDGRVRGEDRYWIALTAAGTDTAADADR